MKPQVKRNVRVQAELQPGTLAICKGNGEHLDDRWATTTLRCTNEAYDTISIIACGVCDSVRKKAFSETRTSLTMFAPESRIPRSLPFAGWQACDCPRVSWGRLG